MPLPGGRPNTLGLHDRELGDLLDRFDGFDLSRPDARRDFVRWPFRRTSVTIRLAHPGGAISTVQMACRNISRRGLAMLHNGYLHPGTRCRVTLPHPTGPRNLAGQVVRCIHRSGVIHEIGISMDEPIDVREYVLPDPLSDCFAMERVKPEQLTGTVLVVDESEIDRRLFKHFLRGTPLQILNASSVDGAVGQIDDSCDLVVADAAMVTDRRLLEVVQARAHAPLLVTSSDTGESIRTLVRGLPDCAFIAKPWSQRLLLRAIAEFVVLRARRRAPVPTASVPDDEAPQLAQNFVTGLPQTVAKLEQALKDDNIQQCRALCLQLAGTAPAVGFKSLGSLAAGAAQTLAITGSAARATEEVRALIAACLKTRVRAA